MLHTKAVILHGRVPTKITFGLLNPITFGT